MGLIKKELILKLAFKFLLPLVLIYFYKEIGCRFENVNRNLDMMCFIGWKEALILYVCYLTFSFYFWEISPEGFAIRGVKWILIVIAYFISYGAFALPYMVISIIDIEISGFWHFLPIFILIDFYSEKLFQKN